MTAGTISDQTAQQVFDSIKGFEEIAILKNFDRDVSTLGKVNGQSMLGRALCFVVLRREGAPDATAFARVMDMEVSEVTAAFRIDDEPKGDAQAFEQLDQDAVGEAPSPG